MVEEDELATVYARLRRELLGRCFSDQSELRELAEASGARLGPVEVVEGGSDSIVLSVRLAGLHDVLVRATRSRPWHPFYVTAVESP